MRIGTYAKKKSTFERYLDLIPAVEQRIALTKLGTSLHNLEIKQGRYVTLRVSPEQRVCGTWHVLDDGMHFVTKCRINACTIPFHSSRVIKSIQSTKILTCKTVW